MEGGRYREGRGRSFVEVEEMGAVFWWSRVDEVGREGDIGRDEGGALCGGDG